MAKEEMIENPLPAKRVRRKKSDSSPIRIKKKKNPSAPKRFKSSYIFFCQMNQQELKSKLPPNPKVSEISKLAAKLWKELPAEDRVPFEDASKRDKERYLEEKASYGGSWKIEMEEGPKKDPSAPKRPMSAFLFFSKEMRTKVKSQNPELHNVEVSRELGSLWRTMTDEEKLPYVTLYEETKKIYTADKAQYNKEKQEQEEEDARKRIEAEREARDKSPQARSQSHFPRMYSNNDYANNDYTNSDYANNTSGMMRQDQGMAPLYGQNQSQSYSQRQQYGLDSPGGMFGTTSTNSNTHYSNNPYSPNIEQYPEYNQTQQGQYNQYPQGGEHKGQYGREDNQRMYGSEHHSNNGYDHHEQFGGDYSSQYTPYSQNSNGVEHKGQHNSRMHGGFETDDAMGNIHTQTRGYENSSTMFQHGYGDQSQLASQYPEDVPYNNYNRNYYAS
mmetsp:Transcript_41842/g.61441  ORF Transcript_41842/g.61441 Transcript_41842/m.61441 type:complete len:444 (+) Transcript_41842:215-1546(+)|eukprot:CAMPEP_0195520496 /NCGR_PEP_ID=MMETSP0794_2-20130614/17037_1 /TAXON_ID=515487 /ORGANISM="Stephanopyxis turris, Strain CCMP 815" /LENGTH=443 /DNA_ID=CAMNT_0040649871 /DNA_START=211 /DNA_END=1545 /DNA_ORIENTATION=+